MVVAKSLADGYLWGYANVHLLPVLLVYGVIGLMSLYGQSGEGLQLSMSEILQSKDYRY